MAANPRVHESGPSKHPERRTMEPTHAEPQKTSRKHGGHHAGPREITEVHAVGGFGVRGEVAGNGLFPASQKVVKDRPNGRPKAAERISRVNGRDGP